MFDTPVDAWYAWLGLSVVSLAVFGVVTALPTAPPPDAAGIAGTVDRVAVTDYDTRATVALDADAVRLSEHRLGLRNEAGTVHATFAYPVVPARRATPLARVLRHGAPAEAFDSTEAFEAAVTRAVTRESRWRPAGDVLVVRQVAWQGSTTTLVGTAASAAEEPQPQPLAESPTNTAATAPRPTGPSDDPSPQGGVR